MSPTDFKRRSSPLEPLKRLGRQVGLNTLYNSVWVHPVKNLRALAEDGGPFERQKTAAGHEEMREAAKTLPSIQSPALDRGSRVHILTGERFWHQSVYCVASLQLVSHERITPVFYSDGSLNSSVKSHIRSIAPWSEFVEDSAINARLDLTLPHARFPTLRSRRESYVHLRKLTDIHTFAGSWKLVLDSDLLFYRTPSALIKWFDDPKPMHMLDVVDNYGYPLDYLESLAGAPLPRRLNVGVCGLDSGSIDWDRVEYWCKAQLDDFGPSYLQEQGLTAMIMASQNLSVLPEADYILMPRVHEGRTPRAIMHHYVHSSKRSYFQYGWRILDRRLRAGRSDV